MFIFFAHSTVSLSAIHHRQQQPYTIMMKLIFCWFCSSNKFSKHIATFIPRKAVLYSVEFCILLHPKIKLQSHHCQQNVILVVSFCTNVLYHSYTYPVNEVFWILVWFHFQSACETVKNYFLQQNSFFPRKL